MKYLSQLAFLLTLLSASASAQVYIFLNGGYNTDAGGITIMGNRTSISQSANGVSEFTDTFEKIDASFGKGSVIAGGFSLYWSENISMEIAAEMLSGGSYTGTTTDKSYVNGILNNNYAYTTTWNFRSLNVLPSLVLRMPSGTVSPFVRIGGMLAFPDIDYQYTSSGGSTFKHDYSGGIGYGMTGALGASVRMIGGLEFWMDIHYASASWSPTKDEYTDMGGVKWNLELKDNFTETYRYVNSKRVPGQKYDVGPTIPLGYAGMSAGIRLVIGGSEPELPE